MDMDRAAIRHNVLFLAAFDLFSRMVGEVDGYLGRGGGYHGNGGAQ